MNKFARLHLLYTLLIVCTAAFLLGMIVFFVRWSLWNINDDFKANADFVRTHFRDQLAQNETILIGLVSFLKTRRSLDLASINAYTDEMLARFPHISMFQIAQYVDSNSVTTYQNLMKQQGIAQPSIRQFGGGAT